MKIDNIKILNRIINYCLKINDIIQRYGDSFDDFYNDEDYQMLISFAFEHIGELVKLFTDEFVEQNKDQIPFKKIVHMRNRIIHDYDSVDYLTL